MEAHFLSDFVKGEDRAKSPEPWYNWAGDCIVYQIGDEAPVAECVDDVLTIYTSAITGNPIGFQIKGVQAMIRHFGWNGLVVESADDGDELKSLSISILLLAAYERGPKTINRRRAYGELLGSSMAKNARIPQCELASLCQ